MAGQLPTDIESHRTDRIGMGKIHDIFAATGEWEYRNITGRDVGTDCLFELIENEQYTGFQYNCQVKSTRNSKTYLNSTGEYFSIPIKISTINYWLNQANPFLLLLIDIETEKVYYIIIQDYVSTLKDIEEKLMSDQESMTIRIPVQNEFNNSLLKELVKNKYTRTKKIQTV